MKTTLHQLLARAAEVWPEAVAISLRGEALTYAELDARSNQLAHAVREAGCGRGDRVALLYRKSFDAYVGLYGIMKAGCAYVPLDARAPLDRLGYIVRDCDVAAVVSTAGVEQLSDGLAEAHPVPRFRLGTDGSSSDHGRIVEREEIAAHGREAPEGVRAVDADLAYILYTSGSTGLPKGVMISHLNALTFVRWAGDYTGLTHEDRVSGHAPLHFDLSIFDIFSTCRAGGTLYPVPEGTSTFPSRQAAWMIDNEINVWYSVPSALSMMAQQKRFDELDFPALRTVVFAGEVFPARFLRAWVESVPHARFMNWYGPTETNVVTAYTVTEAPEEITQPVPIGSACDNTHVFLEDGDGECVTEPGQVGEVCVRGSGVAMGYWGDTEKTGRVFVANRHQPWMNDRVYRTGDLAAWDDAGDLLYQGRRDHQIKSRGYRIEIGDIEAALSDVPAVSEGVVVPVPDELIGNRLIAVVALRDGISANQSIILEDVAKVLPRYMVPESVMVRDALPKTSTGKVDRQTVAASVIDG